jgi:hypothetical protein
MRTVRSTYILLSILLLAGGYGMSQWSYFGGNAPRDAKAGDVPPVQALATTLLLARIVLYLVPRADGEDHS